MKRVYEHRTDIIQGLTKKYSIHKLVYYEQTNDIYNAIEREKHLKKWHRKWKIKLIEKFNPNWDDLYDEVTG
jgi:putative endonuclease